MALAAVALRLRGALPAVDKPPGAEGGLEHATKLPVGVQVPPPYEGGVAFRGGRFEEVCEERLLLSVKRPLRAGDAGARTRC